jgi:hypothetical protein
MPFHLKEQESLALVRLLEGILEAHAKEEVSLRQAEYLLGHLIEGAAKDNKALIDEWLEPGRLQRWKEECRRAPRS